MRRLPPPPKTCSHEMVVSPFGDISGKGSLKKRERLFTYKSSMSFFSSWELVRHKSVLGPGQVGQCGITTQVSPSRLQTSWGRSSEVFQSLQRHVSLSVGGLSLVSVFCHLFAISEQISTSAVWSPENFNSKLPSPLWNPLLKSLKGEQSVSDNFSYLLGLEPCIWHHQ